MAGYKVRAFPGPQGKVGGGRSPLPMGSEELGSKLLPSSLGLQGVPCAWEDSRGLHLFGLRCRQYITRESR